MTDFLARLITLLESLGIDSMVVGSIASTFYGPPRTTQVEPGMIRQTPTGRESPDRGLLRSSVHSDLDKAPC
jgi:hypothetical protein